MKIIITGGKGLLASNILPVFSSSHELIIADIDSQPFEPVKQSKPLKQLENELATEATRYRTDDPAIRLADVPVMMQGSPFSSHGEREGEAGCPLVGGALPVEGATRVPVIEWDIADRDKGEEVIRQYIPDVVINLAAVTNVDGCEACAELANRVNSDAPGIVAGICKEYDVRFVHLSTDYVFDGTKQTPYNEEDKPNPQSLYGMTKWAGEVKAMRNNPSSLIIRAQWLYGDGGENFITKVTRAAQKNGSVEVVDDQRGSPTYARDLAYPLKILIEQGRSGIYHVANSGSCTWFEFAGEIFSQLRMDVQVKPITSAQLNRRAKRPSYSVYDCSKLLRDTGMAMRSWQEALREYLAKSL